MFIGKVGLNNFFNRISSSHQQTNLSPIIRNVYEKSAERKTDNVTINSAFAQSQYETGIYKSPGNQMQAFGNISYTQLTPNEKLQAEILPPSEESSYTADDALMNQYLKQSRIDGHFEGGTFVRDSDEPVKLILKSEVSDAELENFRQKLNEHGLGNDIDWRGVKNDLWNIGVGLDNAERIETKADYLASRYAVLKDRILNQYTGDRQIAEMDQLESIYADARDEMANTYAKNIGGFYEDLGQTGAIADMKASVTAMVDKKAAAYEKQLAQTEDFSTLDESENPWLRQDDAYMAARLREKAAAVSPETETSDTQVKYNAKDLTIAGVYAKSLSSQLENADILWDTEQDDSALGEFLGEQNRFTQTTAGNSGISSGMADVIKNTFEPFMHKFMDALDRSIDKHKEMVSKKPWMQGTIRTTHIDRSRVFRSFQSSLTSF